MRASLKLLAFCSVIFTVNGKSVGSYRNRRQVGSFPVWGQYYSTVNPNPLNPNSQQNNWQQAQAAGNASPYGGYTSGTPYGPLSGFYTLGQLNRNSYPYTTPAYSNNYFGNPNSYNNGYGNNGVPNYNIQGNPNWYGR